MMHFCIFGIKRADTASLLFRSPISNYQCGDRWEWMTVARRQKKFLCHELCFLWTDLSLSLSHIASSRSCSISSRKERDEMKEERRELQKKEMKQQDKMRMRMSKRKRKSSCSWITDSILILRGAKKASGLPCFIFVFSSLSESLHVWISLLLPQQCSCYHE
jgi:hypothetical protein